MTPDAEALLTAPHPVELKRTLGALMRSAHDPAARVDGEGVWWRATRTPEGPATVSYAPLDERTFRVRAWGPGAQWCVRWAPDALGFNDSDAGFQPTGKLAQLHRRFPGIRIPRTRRVFEALLRAVSEQKVSSEEARDSYERMLRAWGEPAPGPARLVLPPSPERVAEQPYYAFHAFNLEMKRANVLREVARHAARLEATVDLPVLEAWRTLGALPGVGPWTVGEVAAVAWGDADAVSLGDWHLPHLVTFAFTGEARGTDARMLQLLEPYRGHRARVLRLLMAAGISPPRFGARRAKRDIRNH